MVPFIGNAGGHLSHAEIVRTVEQVATQRDCGPVQLPVGASHKFRSKKPGKGER